MRDPAGDAREQDAPQSGGVVLGDRHLRMLKIAVVVMGVVLILGFVGVIARIVYLVNRGGETAVTATAGEAARLALPAGANIRHLSLAGTRLAVHYEGPTGQGIVVVDVPSGRPISRMEIVPEAPR